MSSSNIASPYGDHTPLSTNGHSFIQGSSPDYETSDHTYHDAIDKSFLSSHKASRHLSKSSSPSELETPGNLPSETYGDYASFPELLDPYQDAYQDPYLDPYQEFTFHTPGREFEEDEAIVPSIEKTSSQTDANQSPVVASAESTVEPKDSEAITATSKVEPERPQLSQASANMNSQSTSGSLQVPSEMTTTPTGENDASRGYVGTSPRVVLTEWNSTKSHELSASTNYRSPIDNPHVDGYFTAHGPSFAAPHEQEHAPQMESQTAFAPSSFVEEPNRTGLNPSQREILGQGELPNFRDQERKEETDARMYEVQQWMAQADPDADVGLSPGTVIASQTGLGHFDPLDSAANRPNTAPHQHSVAPSGFAAGGRGDVAAEDDDIKSLSSSWSFRQNKIQEGQVYFDPDGNKVVDADIAILTRPRHLYDAPAFQPTVDSELHYGRELTAAQAMEKYSKLADNFSMYSRQATWGTTRRRSEPTLAEMESVGGMFKQMSISKSSEKKPTIFATIGQIVRKKSVGASNKLKRNRSDAGIRGRAPAPREERTMSAATLAPPPRSPSGRRVRPQSPRLQTNFGDALSPGEGSGHSRRASLTAMSPKVGGFFNNVKGSLRRNRSKSDITSDCPMGLSDQWKTVGGPPVANITSPNEVYGDNDNSQHGYSDAEGDDDDEDDYSYDGSLMLQDIDPNTKPTAEAFKQYIRKLNPQMKTDRSSQALVDRLAHQQLARYKTLLDHRLKHQKALQDNKCPSSAVCISQGKTAQPIPSKAAGRSARRQIADDEGSDSNPDNKLGQDAFPKGIPPPPVDKLPARIECQLCFKTRELQKPSDWTKHVHEDVQPFTCTFIPCKEPKSFKRKADWVRHENEIHRHLESWRCNQHDCNHVCHRKDNFLQHLVREHKMQEPKNKSKAAIQSAKGKDAEVWRIVNSCYEENQAQSQNEPCKFCGKTFNTWKKLTVHEAKHMEQISLPIIDLVQRRHIDESTVISPVEPLPAPQADSPITTVMNTPSDTGSYMDMNLALMQGVQNGQHLSQYARQLPPGAATMTSSAGFRPNANGFGNQHSTPSMGFNTLSSNGTGQRVDNGHGFMDSTHNSMSMGGAFHNPFNNTSSPMHEQGPFGNFASDQLLQSNASMMPIDPSLAGQQTYGSGSYASSAADISPNPGSYAEAPQPSIGYSSTQAGMFNGIYAETQPQMHQGMHTTNSFTQNSNTNYGLGLQHSAMSGQGMGMSESMDFSQVHNSTNMLRSHSNPTAHFQQPQPVQPHQQQMFQQQQEFGMQGSNVMAASLQPNRPRSTGSSGAGGPMNPATYAQFGMQR